jgi:hypothetical protein
MTKVFRSSYQKSEKRGWSLAKGAALVQVKCIGTGAFEQIGVPSQGIQEAELISPSYVPFSKLLPLTRSCDSMGGHLPFLSITICVS